jgi:bifunctional non-homologous end joining protein LigD
MKGKPSAQPGRKSAARSKVAGAAGGRLAISNPQKIFWPEEGYTKLDLATFYESVFTKLQPYVQDHLLTLERCPDGMSGACFYQKQMPESMPAGTPSKAIRHAKKTTRYVVGGSLATQLALVNLGCIAVHAMASRARNPRQPEWMCFDLDPQSGAFADAAQAGRYVEEALAALKLRAFAKTSGSRGLHVFVPLEAGLDAQQVLSFAEQFVSRVAAAHPQELTVEHSIAARGQRVYLDPFRNAFAQTVVTPYAVRRRPKAPVSTPLDWSELGGRLSPADFNIGNFAARLKKRDPWADFFRSRQSLESAAARLAKL